MIQALTDIEPFKPFIHELYGDPAFSSPRLSTSEKMVSKLQSALGQPDHLVLGVFCDDNMIGLFSFLILEEERYIEMLACLSRSLNAYEEIGEHLQANYKRFQADFVFHPANALLRAMLTQRNAAFYTEQQQMILSDEHIVTDAAGIQPLSRRYKDQYLSLHGTDTYWTGDRLMEAGDRFRVLLAIDGDEVVGYIDVTVCYEDNEPVDLLVEGSHRRKGWGRKLLAKAIEMNRPKGMKLMVDVDNRPAIALYESLGFVKATGQNSQTATWHIP